MIAAIQQPAVHFRVQRLHAPAQHFGPTSKFGDILHCYAFVAQQFCRAAGRENLDLQGREPPGQLHDPGLVEYAQQRPFHSHVSLRCSSEPFSVRGGAEFRKVASVGKFAGRLNYDFTSAFSFTWPSTTSTTYSTSRQLFFSCRSLVFFLTN